jgi:ABC-type Fe3+-hydroxamate transport system substrate-binding protein
MRRYTSFFLFILSIFATGAALARTVVDQIGRQVIVPDKIERVYAAAPPIMVLVHAIAQQKLIGLSLLLMKKANISLRQKSLYCQFLA